jgi:Cu+-exporting ATPase
MQIITSNAKLAISRISHRICLSRRLLPLSKVITFVLIRHGSRIPVDGEVIGGHSIVEQAAITGEPMPSEKLPGSGVYAGTINQAGILQVRTDRLGKDTAFGKIIEAVERAEHSRAPIQKTADRLAGYLVYFALGAALLTFLLTHNLRSTISVIIVAGACGLPPGRRWLCWERLDEQRDKARSSRVEFILRAWGAWIRSFWIRRNDHLWHAVSCSGKACAWHFRADAARHGRKRRARFRTSAGRAIVRYAEEKNLPLTHPSEFRYEVGRGIVAQVEGERIAVGNRAHLLSLGIEVPDQVPALPGMTVLVAAGDRYYGSISIEDQIRRSAAAAVKALEAMRIRVILLTGDSQAAATAVADQMGIFSFSCGSSSGAKGG